MLYLSFIWHMHQPYYKDLASGEMHLSWVRLHGIKDYLDIVKILENYPKIHQTFGHEIDATLTYDYTEDVQMSLLGRVLLPTKAINARSAADPFRQRAIAAELIGSMKVTF